jgi:hypothetical protein
MNGDESRTRALDLSEYRKVLEQRCAEVSAQYDKTIVTLSGGALAVSFAFVKDLVPHPVESTLWSLFLSWFSFGASLVCILVAMLASTHATRHAIEQVDSGKIYDAIPGGFRATQTNFLNAAAVATFFGGVIFLGYFAATNFSR